MWGRRTEVNDLKSSVKTLTVANITGCAIILAALSMAIYTIVQIKDEPNLFKGLTFRGESGPPSTAEGQIYEEWNIACTNETGGNSTIIFDDLTNIRYRCPQSSDVCKNSMCFTNGTCGFVFKDPLFNCSSNNDCPNGSECRGCNCIERQPCSIDEDCGGIMWTPCIANFCVDGFCQQNNTANATCTTDEGCAPGWICRNCTCVAVPQETCSVDAECGIVKWSTCFGNVCDDGECFSRLTNSSTCVTDGECGEGMECQNCTCVNKFICNVPSDCGEIDWTTCIEWQCQNNTCVQEFSPGSTCVSGEKCPEGFDCKNCTCQSQEQRCMVNDDCPVLNFTNCLSNICVDNFCTPVLSDGNQCTDASLCSSGQICNSNCQCEGMTTFEVVQSGVMTVIGATVFTASYTILAADSVRLLTYDTGQGTASVTDILHTTSGLVDPANRPPFRYDISVGVINNVPTLGTVLIQTNGIISWRVGGGGLFPIDNTVGFAGASAIWTV